MLVLLGICGVLLGAGSGGVYYYRRQRDVPETSIDSSYFSQLPEEVLPVMQALLRPSSTKLILSQLPEERRVRINSMLTSSKRSLKMLGYKYLSQLDEMSKLSMRQRNDLEYFSSCIFLLDYIDTARLLEPGQEYPQGVPLNYERRIKQLRNLMRISTLHAQLCARAAKRIEEGRGSPEDQRALEFHRKRSDEVLCKLWMIQDASDIKYWNTLFDGFKGLAPEPATDPLRFQPGRPLNDIIFPEIDPNMYRKPERILERLDRNLDLEERQIYLNSQLVRTTGKKFVIFSGERLVIDIIDRTRWYTAKHPLKLKRNSCDGANLDFSLLCNVLRLSPRINLGPRQPLLDLRNINPHLVVAIHPKLPRLSPLMDNRQPRPASAPTIQAENEFTIQAENELKARIQEQLRDEPLCSVERDPTSYVNEKGIRREREIGSARLVEIIGEQNINRETYRCTLRQSPLTQRANLARLNPSLNVPLPRPQ